MIELEQLRDFALEIAPELGDRKFYVADMEAAGLPTTGTGGFAIDYMPENALSIPDWDGPGAVLVINYGGNASRANPEASETVLKAITLHEVAHLVPQPSPELLRVQVATRKQPAAEITADMHRELKTPAHLSPHCIKAHGPLFIRRCVHLWARALAGRHRVFGRHVLGYEWLSWLEYYAAPLLGDAINMMDARFDEIDRLPLPQHTVDLHAENVKRYHLYHGKDLQDAT